MPKPRTIADADEFHFMRRHLLDVPSLSVRKRVALSHMPHYSEEDAALLVSVAVGLERDGGIAKGQWLRWKNQCAQQRHRGDRESWNAARRARYAKAHASQLDLFDAVEVEVVEVEPPDPMKSHQRVIRERESAANPRLVETSLEGAWVEAITRDEAAEVILRYEWLGTMPNVGLAYYGLRTASGELAGVVCFGTGMGTKARDICGAELADSVICLERGACVHWAHPHSGSFLVARACKLAAKEHGWRCFYAYSDVEAGEIGTIYQACNWVYIGQAPGRSGNHRSRFTMPDGTVLSSRSMRAHLKREFGTGTITDHWPNLEWMGWTRDREVGKHKYVHFTDKHMRKALRYPTFDYPKRTVAA